MTTTNLLKVLIVEDKEDWQGIWGRFLKGEGIEVLEALTLKEGEQLFESNPDLALVIMDGCVGGEELNSTPLVQKMRQTFDGPIVAASGSPSFRKELMKAGCSHEARKDMVSALVSRILKVL